eukprot:40846-Pyramimonas_sp.AAC.1
MFVGPVFWGGGNCGEPSPFTPPKRKCSNEKPPESQTHSQSARTRPQQAPSRQPRGLIITPKRPPTGSTRKPSKPPRGLTPTTQARWRDGQTAIRNFILLLLLLLLLPPFLLRDWEKRSEGMFQGRPLKHPQEEGNRKGERLGEEERRD